jgi:sugar lactone lactonase YvrE
MPDGQTRIVAEGLAFPNGMVITPDGRMLIVAESYVARLTAFTIASDGSLSQRHTAHDMAQFEQYEGFGEEQITSDGICLDAEGALWIASPNTKEVLRVREGGQITTRIRLGSIAIDCMLDATERRTLFIITSDSQNPQDTQAKGRIEILRVDVLGAGLPW